MGWWMDGDFYCNMLSLFLNSQFTSSQLLNFIMPWCWIFKVCMEETTQYTRTRWDFHIIKERISIVKFRHQLFLPRFIWTRVRYKRYEQRYSQLRKDRKETPWTMFFSCYCHNRCWCWKGVLLLWPPGSVAASLNHFNFRKWDQP